MASESNISIQFDNKCCSILWQICAWHCTNIIIVWKHNVMLDNIKQQKMKQCHAKICHTLYVGMVCLYMFWYVTKKLSWERTSLTDAKARLDRTYKNNLTPHARAMAKPTGVGGMSERPATAGALWAVRQINNESWLKKYLALFLLFIHLFHHVFNGKLKWLFC